MHSRSGSVHLRQCARERPMQSWVLRNGKAPIGGNPALFLLEKGIQPTRRRTDRRRRNSGGENQPPRQPIVGAVIHRETGIGATVNINDAVRAMFRDERAAHDNILPSGSAQAGHAPAFLVYRKVPARYEEAAKLRATVRILR